MYRIVELWYCTPETYIALYVNHTVIKIKNNTANTFFKPIEEIEDMAL